MLLRTTKYPILTLVFIFSIITSDVTAQKSKNNLKVGISSGLLLFYGDIKVNDFIPATSNKNEIRLGTGISLSRSFNPILGGQINLLLGSLSGTSRIENQYFVSKLWEWDVCATININEILYYNQRSKKDLKFNLLIGAGLVNFRSIVYELATDNIIKTSGYSADGSEKFDRTNELVIPIGINGAYSLSNLKVDSKFIKNCEIVSELKLYYANTDKFDLNNELRSGNDKFSYFSLGLVYNFK